MPIQNRSHVPLGSVLEGKYRVTREIGRGGMAAVYEAVNVDIGKRVAVKVLAAELITSRVVRERFIREARASVAIRSPYICDVYDSGMFDERPFLVMELLEGESLYDMMTRVRRLDFPTTIRVITHTCRGLTKAHDASIIHRDLKPENIFLTENEEGEMVAKILDFGLAKFYDPTGGDAAQARLTREGALFGTPAYMSPEQAKGQGEVDLRADLWALGCIAYECLTGQTVWNVEQGVAMILAQIAGAPLPRPSKLRSDLPRSFDNWFARALDRDIENRFQTAKEFAESLTEALQPTRSQLGRPPPHPPREVRQSVAEEQIIDQLIGPPSPPSQQPASDRRGLGPNGGALRTSSQQGVNSSAEGNQSWGGGGAPLILSGDPTHNAAGAGQSPAAPQVLDRISPQPDATGGDIVPRRTSNAGAAITALLSVGALAFGSYAFWLYVMNPPPPAVPIANTVTSALGDGGLDDGGDDVDGGERTAAPLERDSYALQIGTAQEWLAKGRFDTAVKLLKEASHGTTGGGVARTLLAQVTAAAESKDACIVTGLGRPRPFDLVVNSSAPALTITKSGPLIGWLDNHLDRTRQQGYAVLLDDSLRRVSMTHSITPEARTARDLDLSAAGDDIAAVYGDREGTEPGLYARLLERDGRIAGSARKVAVTSATEQNPEAALTRAGDGTFWAVWAQVVESGVRDLFARHLTRELTPIGEPIRLTRLKPIKGTLSGMLSPAIAVSQGFLYLAVSLERGTEAQVMLLRTSLADPLLKTGLSQEVVPKVDKFVGTMQPLSTVKGKNISSKISCVPSGCFVVWDHEKGGAYAAYVNATKGEKLWHRELAPRGSDPNIAEGGGKSAVAWFDSGRLRLAGIDRDGVGQASTVAKISGSQPPPILAAGNQPGQWYIAWRDFESGHLEAFVVRAQCR